MAMQTRMTSGMLLLGFAALSLAMLANADAPKAAAKAEPTAAAKSGPTDAELIKSAMSAAPAAVGKNATIVAMEADGKMRVLRKGPNGFTCIPHNPATPGPDPICADANALQCIPPWVRPK